MKLGWQCPIAEFVNVLRLNCSKSTLCTDHRSLTNAVGGLGGAVSSTVGPGQTAYVA